MNEDDSFLTKFWGVKIQRTSWKESALTGIRVGLWDAPFKFIELSIVPLLRFLLFVCALIPIALSFVLNIVIVIATHIVIIVLGLIGCLSIAVSKLKQ